VSGACPRNFQPVHGDVLLAPIKDCDMKIKLQAGDDYFLTSNVRGKGAGVTRGFPARNGLRATGPG
jgi:hypothetical protein